MNDPKRRYANTDEAPPEGGFSNEDANIEHQRNRDRAEEQDVLPDPAGERHAPLDETERLDR